MSNKSEATWHPNSAPEVPHADLDALLDAALTSALTIYDVMKRVPHPYNAVAEMTNEWAHDFAALAFQVKGRLAALGDTVPANASPAITIRAEYENTVLAKQLVEDRAERDALAVQDNRVRHILASGYGDIRDAVADLQEAVASAPAVSLALHDAEVKAQALDEFADAYYFDAGWKQAARDRAAAIREEAK